MIRSPIISVLGHVDHGKTSLLDAIRGTFVTKLEEGGITQMIGASYVRKATLEKYAKEMKHLFPFQIKIPGILFIDTPGHEAFTSLRERGGSISDLSILVIDINQGVQAQTIESIDILKAFKTPFVVALTKIDTLPGWKKTKHISFLKAFEEQSDRTKAIFDEKLYEIIAQLSMHGFNAELFSRVKDFTRELCIIPVSSKTKEGLAELLLLITGLSQKFLEKRLEIRPDEPMKGTIMEAKNQPGLGFVIDVIIYDGHLKEGDEVAFLTLEGVRTTRVRGIFFHLISGHKEKLEKVKEVYASAGIRIFAPNLEGALPGSSVLGIKNNFDEIKKLLEEQYKRVVFESEEDGVIVKADSLGSLEAIRKYFENLGIPISSASLGSVRKEDVLKAKAMYEKNPDYGVVIAYNVKIGNEAREMAEREGIAILASSVLYQLSELYEGWKKGRKERERRAIFEKLPYPCKIKVLPGYFFRMSKPAIFGIKILEGRLKPRMKLMKESGEIIGEVISIQKEKRSLSQASRGEEVAIAVDNAVLEKDVEENDILYSFFTREQIRTIEKYMHLLNNDERELLKEIKKILGLLF